MRPRSIVVIHLVVSVLAMATLDRPLAEWAVGPRSPKIAAELSGLLSAIPPLALMAAGGIIVAEAVRKALRRPAFAVGDTVLAARFVMLSTLCAALASWPLKFAIGRARPLLSGGSEPFDFFPFAIELSAAFPSTQAAMAGGLAMSLALLRRRLHPALFCVASAICISRVLAGAHWLSDVIMGFGLGVATAVFLAGRFAARGRRFPVGRTGVPPRATARDDGSGRP